MNEVKYFNETYDKFWKEQTKKYGYTAYEKYIVNLVVRSKPKRVFAVGIGTGWPMEIELKKSGIIVDGCDLAESAVMEARKALESESGIWVGDVLTYGGDVSYDVVYCARASWYIPDFYKTIEKMISMTKAGGYIVFDVMDENSLYCLKTRLKSVRDKYFEFIGIDMDEVYGQHYINISEMKKFLKKSNIGFEYWRERTITHNSDKYHTPKVIFYCRKEQGI